MLVVDNLFDRQLVKRLAVDSLLPDLSILANENRALLGKADWSRVSEI
jgi:hypothetical protein